MTPQIIRTRAELENIDRDAAVTATGNPSGTLSAGEALTIIAADERHGGTIDPGLYFPLVVLATGEHVRAARDALSAAKGGNQ